MPAALDIDDSQVIREMVRIRIVRKVVRITTRPCTIRNDATTVRSNVGQMT
jgi:hypothetical protein